MGESDAEIPGSRFNNGRPGPDHARAKRFQREIPSARLAAFEGAGHFVFDQEREWAIKEVTSFLSASP